MYATAKAEALRSQRDFFKSIDMDDAADHCEQAAMAWDSSNEDNRLTVGAFMDHDQQGVALFLGGGDVLIVHDDETTAGNAVELTDIQRAVLGARLRKISYLITTGQLS